MHFSVGKIGAPSIGQLSYQRYVGLRNPIKSNTLSIDANGLRKATTNNMSRDKVAPLKTAKEEGKSVLNKLHEPSYLQTRTITFHYGRED
jgi:hypothetical protein